MILRRGIILLGVIAIISIALNLFLAGDQLGRHFRGPPGPPNFEQRLHGLWHDLPAADQTIAQAILDRHYNDIMDKWHAFRPANQRASLAMRADPFDPAEAKAAYDIANQRWEDLRPALQDTRWIE